MIFERHGQLPACRLTQQDLSNLGDIFQAIQGATNATGVYKVETPWGTYSADKLTLQSQSYASGDVGRIEMTLQWADGNAGLTIDLDVRPLRNSPAAFDDRSWLAVEGQEDLVRPLWRDVMDVVDHRRTILGAIVSSPTAQIVGLLVAILAGILLPYYTLKKAQVNDSVAVPVVVATAFIAALMYTFVLLPAAAPRVQVAGWGRLSNRRGRIAFWGVTIASGLVVWAITLAVTFWLSK